jgi:hypothetical protein
MYKLLLLLTVGLLVSGCGVKQLSQMQVTPSEVVKNNSVPLPSQEDIIRNFFGLINEKRVPEAIDAMSDKAVPNDEIKDQWEAQFGDFDSVKVTGIEKSIEENLYKVTMEVEINLRAANYPIPYYGYDDKTDIRFIKLVQDSKGVWKIDGISTGP